MGFREKLGEAFIEVPVDDKEWEGWVGQTKGKIRDMSRQFESFGKTMTTAITVPAVVGTGIAIAHFTDLETVLERTGKGLEALGEIAFEAFQRITGAIEDALGVAFIPLENAFIGLKSIVLDVIGEMEVKVSNLALGIGALTAAAGPMSFVFGRVTKALSGFLDTQSAILKVVFNVTRLIKTFVQSIAFAFITISFATKVLVTFGGVLGTVGTILASVIVTTGEWGDILEAVDSFIRIFIPDWGDMLESVGRSADKLLKSFSNYLDTTPKMVAAFTALTLVAGGLVSVLGSLLMSIGSVVASTQFWIGAGFIASEVITQLVSDYEGLGLILATVAGVLSLVAVRFGLLNTAILSTVGKAISTAVTSFVSFAGSITGAVIPALWSAMGPLRTLSAFVLGKFALGFKSAIQGAIRPFTTGLSKVASKGASTATSGLTSLMGTIGRFVSSSVKNMVSALGTLIRRLAIFGAVLVGNAWAGVKALTSSVITLGKNLVALASATAGVVTAWALLTAGSFALGAGIGFLIRKIPGVSDVVDDVVEGFRTWFNEVDSLREGLIVWWKGVKLIFTSLKRFMVSKVTAIKDGVLEAFSKLKNKATGMMTKMFEVMKNKAQEWGVAWVFGSIFPDVIWEALYYLQKLPDKGLDYVNEFVSGAKNSVETLKDDPGVVMKEFTKVAGANLKETAKGGKSIIERLVGGLKGKVGPGIKRLTKGIKWAKENVGDDFQEIKNNALKELKGLAKQIGVPVEQIEDLMNVLGVTSADKMLGMAKSIKRGFNRMVDGVSGSLASLVTEGESQMKSLGDTVKRTMQSILKNVLKMLVVKPLIAGAASGLNAPDELVNAIDPSFNSEKQLGGPVTAGKSYIVGERGPEVFNPDTSGEIISNKALKGGGEGGQSSVFINIQDDTSERVNIDREKKADGKQFVNVILNEVGRDIKNNGPISQAMQSTFGVSRQGSRGI